MSQFGSTITVRGLPVGAPAYAVPFDHPTITDRYTMD